MVAFRRNPFTKAKPEDVPIAESTAPAYDQETGINEHGGYDGKETGVVGAHPHSGSEKDSDSISLDAQRGVQKIEATTKVWTKKHLIAAYIIIWVIYFVDAMQQSSTSVLGPYVTSAFSEHSLTATTSIFSSLIGGLFKLPLAKIVDVWGRPQGFMLCAILLTLGLIMMAACQNVETYAAAQVFYWVGYNGLDYTMSVFIADTSKLKNRGLMFGFTNSPYIITVWVGGYIASSFLYGAGWRWAFGTFAIVTPVVCTPLWALFYFNYRKAKKMGLVPPKTTNRTFIQSCKYYFIQFDVFGVLLLCAGLALFLLSFNIYTLQTLGWKSPMIICFLVFGIVLIILFALYERYLAPVTYIPYRLLLDRTVAGACLVAAVVFVSFYIWDSYFTSFIQVVQGVSVVHTTYISNIYSIGSCFWSIVVGLAIRHTGRFKWPALYFGVPLTILGVGLMIHFRQPDVNIGYVVMCQIFIALAGGTLVICEQIAVMAATTHQYVAVVLAIEGMFSSIGGAIGSTIAAAIWQGVFPYRLAEYLPEESQANLTDIYGSLEIQLSYPMGSPTRDAINQAYGDAQKYMLIAATAVLSLAIGGTLLWRDIKIKDFKQVKGTVA